MSLRVCEENEVLYSVVLADSSAAIQLRRKYEAVRNDSSKTLLCDRVNVGQCEAER